MESLLQPTTTMTRLIAVIKWALGVTVLALAIALAYRALRAAQQTDATVFPSIAAIGHKLSQQRTLFWREARSTTEASIEGLVLGSALAVTSALFARLVQNADYVLTPFAILLKATPIAALSPFLIVILKGNAYLVPVASSVLVSFFPVYVVCRTGLRSHLEGLAEYADSLQLSPWRRLVRLEVPSTLSFAMVALQTAAPMAVVGTTVGEMMVGKEGMGELILRQLNRASFDTLYGAIVVTGAIGVFFFCLGSLAARFLSGPGGSRSFGEG